MADPNRTLELLWGMTDPPTRGPRPSLSTQRIVETAIAIADTEGLPAVSLHRVAKELGVTTMSLYRYIQSKDELLELMFDAAIDAVPSPTGGPWREQLANWAWETKRLYSRRPWMVELPITGPPMGPNNLAAMNAALEAMAETSLTEDDKLFVLLLLSIYVRGESIMGVQMVQAERRTGISEAERGLAYMHLMRKIAHDDRFPALARLAQSGIFEEMGGDPDNDFDFGLQRILDGVQVLITSREQDPDHG